MKRKILGALIALCMVSAFVGCTDPSSEKPGVNYKDSGFVGTWVFEEIKECEWSSKGFGVYRTTYILNDDGTGKRWECILPSDASGNIDNDSEFEEDPLENVIWKPFSNTQVTLEYIDWLSDSTMLETGILSADKTNFTIVSQEYTKQP